MIQCAVRAGWKKSANTAWKYDKTKLICSLVNINESTNQSSKSNLTAPQLGVVDKSSDLKKIFFEDPILISSVRYKMASFYHIKPMGH